MQLSYRNGMITVAIAGLLWSLMGLAIRMIGDVGTWQVLFWRSTGMLPVLFVWIWFQSAGKPFRALRAVGLPGTIGATGLVLAFAGAIYAYQNTTVANAAFLFSAAPLITAVLAWPLLKEPVRPATWIAIAIALVGIVLMVREGLALGAMAGNAAALASAAGFAAFTLSLRWGRLGNMLPAVMLGGAFALVVSALVIEAGGGTLAVPLRSGLLAAAMGAVLLSGGLILYTLGSKALPAAELGLLSMVEVLCAPIWVWVFWNEIAGRGTLIGGAVLMVGILFNALTGLRHRPPVVL